MNRSESGLQNVDVPENELDGLEGEYPERLEVQDKIIRIVDRSIGSSASIAEGKRTEFLERMAKGDITKEKLAKILAEIGPDGKPIRQTGARSINEGLEPYEAVKKSLQQEPARRILLNLIFGRPPESAFSVPEIMVLMDQYPEPGSFEKAVSKTGYGLNPASRKDLYRHARTLAKMLYGEREEYWEQFKLMEAEAAFIFRSEPKLISEMSEQESKELLARVQIHGDPWEGRALTARDLETEGLAPKIRVEVEGMTIWFSSAPYLVTKTRPAVVGYLENRDHELVARSFYRSGSHGIWKYLPKYLIYPHRWYDKGFDEQSISLPVPFQRALVDIAKRVPTYVEESDLVFLGTARNIAHFEENTYQQEIRVKEESIPLRGNFYPKSEGSKVPPRELVFEDPEQAPDFSRKLMEWEDKTPIYGKVAVEVFSSRDGALRYMFVRDTSGRAWIATVDTDSEISSVGVRKEWANTGDLATPAYDYDDNSGGYGNPDLEKGRYIDMFKNYLSEVPVIQEYLAHVKDRK